SPQNWACRMEPCNLPAVGDPASAFYGEALTSLNASGIPFLVGGAFALSRYTGICRDTKDLDIFVRPSDLQPTLDFFQRAGFWTEFKFPHWLGKVHCGDHFIDVIFSSGNGVARVDHLWFEHAVSHDILGLPVRLCPPEEMIWSKAFIQERE